MCQESWFTCGRSLGESMSHSTLPLAWVALNVWEQRELNWGDLAVLISLGTFLYVIPQRGNQGTVPIRQPDSAYVSPVMINTQQDSEAGETVWALDREGTNGGSKLSWKGKRAKYFLPCSGLIMYCIITAKCANTSCTNMNLICSERIRAGIRLEKTEFTSWYYLIR